MVTVDEEIQAKEFLKRTEIRTMKKDLRALREVDALKERDKIATIKTLEVQLEEKKKANEKANIGQISLEKEKIERNEILQKNENQERIAEKDLKDYATEQERQQIFLLESQRLGFEKQIDEIDKEKDPVLKLEKNQQLLQKRDQQAKLNSILEQEKKLEDEEKFVTEKEQTTTVPNERKSLEQSRWELDKKIQEIEKQRWEVEKQVEDADIKTDIIDKSSEQLIIEKNNLRDKVLGVDKSLREIFSIVMNREEERIKGQAKEQIAKREAAEKLKVAENEKVQRQQWSGKTEPINTIGNKSILDNIPVPVKRKVAKTFEDENEARKKFLREVEEGVAKNQSGTQQKSNT